MVYTNVMKFWLKTMLGEKITADGIFEITQEVSTDSLSSFLHDKLLDYDLPTPVILSEHINKLKSFNVVRFKRDDFVESTPFDVMVLEVLKEEKKNKNYYF